MTADATIRRPSFKIGKLAQKPLALNREVVAWLSKPHLLDESPRIVNRRL
ncbi:Uncharacterised protein [Mycobacterium tuberculosis]|nr:Uncharacterised protein [Mycobacterium tuberculosis]